MRKEYLYALIALVTISLISCGILNKSQNARNSLQQKQGKQSTKEKTVILKGKDFKGANLTAFDEKGKQINFQIRNVELDPKDPEKETYLYTVFYLDNTDSKWKNLCKPDVENVAKAIPLAGAWDEKGAYLESSKSITFGCTNGALAKCVRFGYKPWKTVKGTSLRDFHQACTRMVRADYCGDGKGHTRDGTLINIYDVLGIQAPTANKKMVFEAAWQPNGATCVNHPRWFETLSDIRKECPEKLKSHLNEDGSCTTAQTVSHNKSDALLFNDSFIRKP